MSDFATLPPRERDQYFRRVQQDRGIPAFYVEKDFWVCWMLARVFTCHGLAEHVVFKGGTSLSKVWDAIRRFSEDIDLSVSPALLGIAEGELERSTRSGRERLRARLEKSCCDWVERTAGPELERMVGGLLGNRADGRPWLEYRLDESSNSPTLLFRFPRVDDRTASYGLPYVKLELGSLTDQQPTGRHEIAAFVDAAAPGAFPDCRMSVLAVGIERTLWEKATILHAEFHRPAERPMRDRFARHYADFAELWLHPATGAGRRDHAMLARVADHKEMFFRTGFSSYHTAKPGTLRLVPPAHRLRELHRDYAAMRPMFMDEPRPLESLLAIIGEAESAINAR